MNQHHSATTYELTEMPERPEDFLSPEQRQKAIAHILCTIALRALRKRHENLADTQSSK